MWKQICVRANLCERKYVRELICVGWRRKRRSVGNFRLTRLRRRRINWELPAFAGSSGDGIFDCHSVWHCRIYLMPVHSLSFSISLCPISGSWIQDFFPDSDIFWSDLQQFIGINKLQRLFQAKDSRRSKFQCFIRSGSSGIC